MKMQQVSDSCYAVLNEKNRVCGANSGLTDRCMRIETKHPGASKR